MGRPDGLPEDLPISLQKGCNYRPMPTGCARPVDKDVQSFTNMQLPLRFRMGHHHLPQKKRRLVVIQILRSQMYLGWKESVQAVYERDNQYW